MAHEDMARAGDGDKPRGDDDPQRDHDRLRGDDRGRGSDDRLRGDDDRLRGDDDRLRRALALIASVARERFAAAGGNGRAAEVELALRLPLRPHGDPRGEQAALAAAATALDAGLALEVEALVAGNALCHPGNAFCARCASSTCEHATPAGPREAFAGYGPTGLPRFLDLGQLLLERKHPRVAELYDERPQLVSLVLGWGDLAEALLPAYRSRFGDLRLHGQVVCGWYRSPTPAGGHDRLAVTFQLLSNGRGRRRRYRLHQVGGGASRADLQPLLEAVHERHGRLPWREPLRWAQTTLAAIESAARRPRPPAPAAIDSRLQGLLLHLGEALERPFRSRERRTAHAEVRHQGGRPTRAAVADLRAAPGERVLFDPRHETFVVLGPRGRTHVFGSGGKLVTSVRYPAATIERRQKSGAWRATTGEQASALRARVEELVAAVDATS